MWADTIHITRSAPNAFFMRESCIRCLATNVEVSGGSCVITYTSILFFILERIRRLVRTDPNAIAIKPNYALIGRTDAHEAIITMNNNTLIPNYARGPKHGALQLTLNWPITFVSQYKERSHRNDHTLYIARCSVVCSHVANHLTKMKWQYRW